MSSDDWASDEEHTRMLQGLLEKLRSNESAMSDLRDNLSKVSQRKIPFKKPSDKCVHCDAKVELEKLKEFVTCKGCEELACHNQKCSEFIFGLDVWECARCKNNRVIQQRAGEWLLKQLNQFKNSDGSIQLNKENVLNLDDAQSLAAFVSQNQRDKVRQFMEELLAKMLDGGPLDDISVGQLSTNENCLPIIGPIPSTTTHQELKKFVQGICEDIVNLTDTLDFSGVPGRRQEHEQEYFDPKKYEQLLATAVLNKMTDVYQNDKNSQNNSSGVHSDVELDSNHNQLNGETVIDLMVKRDDAGQFSSPTIERLNSKAVDDETHLSDYVQSHYVPLPDLSASDSANDDVDVQSVNSSNGTDGTWEDNWLFKKRKLKTENQSIAMLVPSPTEEIKTLIGDKNADETSDLSENSDAEDEDDGNKKARTFTNTLLIEPKHHQQIAKITLTSSPSPDSLISLHTDNPTVITEAKNDQLLIDDASTSPATQQVQQINFVLSGPVTTDELSVTINEEDEEKEFDSIVSPNSAREHGTTIDEQFEKLLMDDNNNTPVRSSAQKIVSVTAEKTQANVTALPQPTPQSATTTDLSDEEWVIVPNVNDTEESESIETNTSLKVHPSSPTIHKSDTFGSQTELAELEQDAPAGDSPKQSRYSSPLFQQLLKQPIEPVKLSKPTIPEDDSINNLLHVASMVSKTQKTPKIVTQVEQIENDQLTTTNNTNTKSSEEAIDESLLKQFSVTEKRPSIQDPEKVLMDGLIHGSIAEREHIKWLHAAPIANNPYSTEALQRRLSESDHKHKGLDIGNNKLVDSLVEESNATEAEKEENEEVFRAKKVDMKKYKRDYYINDAADTQKRHSYGSSTSKSPSLEPEDQFESASIVPVKSPEKTFFSHLLQSGNTGSTSDISDPDIPENSSTPKSPKSADDSLTYSEDSDTTRIYNLKTGETKIVAPVEESPIESPVKLAQQFFRDLPKRAAEIRKMDDEVTTVIRTSNRNLMNGDGHIIEETYEEKQVIEAELELPSVKKLAEIYGKESSTTEIQLNKPKSFLRLTSTEDVAAPVVQQQKVSRPSSDSFAPNYNHDYHPAMPIASITARSIPSQIRADLKKSYSYDEETLVRHDEREGSPDIQPGVTRNSIAFYENLKKN